MSPDTNNRPNKIYSRIVMIFMILTVIAIGVVLNFALATATIKINSYQTDKEADVLVEVWSEGNTEASADAIVGKILNTEFTTEVEQTVAETKVAGQRAAGYVTIYNNYSKSQPLVKTTRLLTADNRLYRLSEGVTIPAGSQVTVWIEADKDGEEFLTGPAKFTIPGLWEGLQDKIYAQNTDAMQLQNSPKYVITQADLDAAQAKLEQTAKEQSLKTFNELLSDNLKINEQNLSLKFENVGNSPTVGDEGKQFTLKKKIKVSGLVFSKDDLIKTAQEKFKKDLPGNESLVSIKNENFRYNIAELNIDRDRAVLNVKFPTIVSTNTGLTEIDKNKLTGLTESQAMDYLRNELKIDGAQIKLSPFWVKKIPTLKDHIIIE